MFRKEEEEQRKRDEEEAKKANIHRAQRFGDMRGMMPFGMPFAMPFPPFGGMPFIPVPVMMQPPPPMGA